MLTAQAKVLSASQTKTVLMYLETTRNPIRNRLIFLLSIKSGLRAKEISNLTWSMVSDAEGIISEEIRLEDRASKGRSGGVIPMASDLRLAFKEWRMRSVSMTMSDAVITTERSRRTTPQVIVNMFRDWYSCLGFEGCSSHSGRRTFITNLARKISLVGGSMRDVQMLARHASLNMTQRYIEIDTAAQRKVIDLI